MYCTVCGCDISAVWWWFRRWMLVITHCISRRWSVVTIPKKIRYLVWGNPLIFNILKMHLEIYCLYLGNIEMCCMFKVYCLLLYFSQNSIYFIILSFCGLSISLCCLCVFIAESSDANPYFIGTWYTVIYFKYCAHGFFWKKNPLPKLIYMKNKI